MAVRAWRVALSDQNQGGQKAGNVTATDVVDAEYFASVLVEASRRVGPAPRNTSTALLARRANLYYSVPRGVGLHAQAGPAFYEQALCIREHNHPCIVDGWTLDSDRIDTMALRSRGLAVPTRGAGCI
ncbi:hypothetical protein HPB52_007922 [Rhipicephalus sanguineus]|uniref:Uncharacterized protein n=1 Tax=Rhipicephalus sanguineus TaxID=34632 RepID=A0A9D4Q956_RHISA|nr:hypothetical protein HPB52_007922 [Rhipicephalus sanguineus]